MNISKFHDEGLRGQGFKIALLDTGIQKHTNLKIKDGINVYDSRAPWNENLAKHSWHYSSWCVKCTRCKW